MTYFDYFVVGLCIGMWFLSGISGFIYWWTTEYDLGLSDAIFAVCVMSWLGPLMWGIGWTVHGKTRLPDIVVMKRRHKR
jgi:hypothetical protein